MKLKTFSGRLSLPKPYNDFVAATDVRIPAGACPIKLKKINTKEEAKEHIKVWCHNLRLHFLNSGLWLSNEALCYFLTQEFEIDSPKWLAGCKLINREVDIIRKT